MAQAAQSHYCSNELITFFLHGTLCSSGVAWLGLSHFPWSSMGPDQCARHKLNNFVHTLDALTVLLEHIGEKKSNKYRFSTVKKSNTVQSELPYQIESHLNQIKRKDDSLRSVVAQKIIKILY